MKNLLLMLIWGMNTLMLHHFLNFPRKLGLFIFLAGIIVLFVFGKKLYISIVPPLILVVLLIWLSTIQASNDLDWLTEVSVLPRINIEDDVITIEKFRNFTWQDINSSDQNWETRSYNLSKLKSLSLIVVPFHDSKYMAHTMLDFEFADQGHVIISVESRKEKNEAYSLVAGALKQLELIYVIGSERDLLTLRAVHRGSKIHLYPIKAEPEFMNSLFNDLSKSANSLNAKPQFYRTLRDNCTTTLVKHIDRHYQQKIGLRLETIFPAKAGELLHELGKMDTHLPYYQAYEASRIDHIVNEYQDEENFSSKLHARINLAYADQ
ncbi:MAG: DUF4105 domain-containing protein [Gammaproteobacteria bacterium]|nr:MAG: DUF4105 domain-containing protein [Gammaproteobacteria bacterium]